jgi:hypothetical protein
MTTSGQSSCLAGPQWRIAIARVTKMKLWGGNRNDIIVPEYCPFVIRAAP